METLYQILDRYFTLHAGISPDENLEFTPARKIATFTKSGASASLAFTAPATWTARGTNSRRIEAEDSITTLVRAKPKNYHVLSPEKAVYAWVKQMDRQIMAGKAHGVYELRAYPFVQRFDSLYFWLEGPPEIQSEAIADRAIETAIERIVGAQKKNRN